MRTEAAKPQPFRFLGEKEYPALWREEEHDYVRDAVRATLREIPVVNRAPREEETT